MYEMVQNLEQASGDAVRTAVAPGLKAFTGIVSRLEDGNLVWRAWQTPPSRRAQYPAASGCLEIQAIGCVLLVREERVSRHCGAQIQGEFSTRKHEVQPRYPRRGFGEYGHALESMLGRMSIFPEINDGGSLV
jgi:hypothetical protein